MWSRVSRIFLPRGVCSVMGYIYILGTIFFTVYGQLVIKWRIVDFGSLPDGFWEKIHFLFKLLIDPFIFSGFVAAFLASLCWMAAMTKFDLSHAYPLIVGGLVILTSLFAIVILKEPIYTMRIIGIALIIAGVFLVGKVPV